MELLLASLAAYAASRVLADSAAPAAPASPATATQTATATPPASPAAQVRPPTPQGLAGRDALAAMGIIPGAPHVVTDLRTKLDRTAKTTAQPARPAESPALTTLEQLAKQRATQQTKLFAMPAGDATVNPVGTGVAVALDRLPADHYTFAEGWYRART